MLDVKTLICSTFKASKVIPEDIFKSLLQWELMDTHSSHLISDTELWNHKRFLILFKVQTAYNLSVNYSKSHPSVCQTVTDSCCVGAQGRAGVHADIMDFGQNTLCCLKVIEIFRRGSSRWNFEGVIQISGTENFWKYHK